MRKALLALALIATLTVAAVVFWAQDANRLKPQLEAQLSNTLGMPVTIDGDVSWQLWPPLAAQASTLRAQDDEYRYAVERLTLSVQFGALFSNVDFWRVETLTLAGAERTSSTDRLYFDTLTVSDFRPDRWAELNGAGQHNGTPFEVEGELRQNSGDLLALDARALHLRMPAAAATCDLSLREQAGADTDAEDPPDALLPITMLRAYALTADCSAPTFDLEGAALSDVRLQLASDGHALKAAATAGLFEGQGELVMEISELKEVPTWVVKPTLKALAPAPFMAWLGRPLDWSGTIDVSGELQATGNTTAAIAESQRIDLSFDGGEGSIDIRGIKAQLAQLARYTSEAESVSRWPDTWDYLHMVGAWRGQGDAHSLDFALDNLSVLADGTYDLLADNLDMNASMTFGNDARYSGFDVNPLLVGLPIPTRCRGALSDISCRIDQGQALANVGKALTSGEDTALKRRLEEKIDEEVPEAYRDAARSLLELLTRGSDGR